MKRQEVRGASQGADRGLIPSNRAFMMRLAAARVSLGHGDHLSSVVHLKRSNVGSSELQPWLNQGHGYAL